MYVKSPLLKLYSVSILDWRSDWRKFLQFWHRAAHQRVTHPPAFLQQTNENYSSSLENVNVNIPRKNTDNVIKTNKCNQCDYATSHPGQLRRRFKTHSREKSNMCYLCDFASSEAANLKRHLQMHSGEKSNKCNLCDFACLQAGNLRNHFKTHSGKKSNKCNQCDFASSLASSLRRHLKMHSGEK